MRQDYWQLGTWGRIPVSMHWTVLLAFAWLYLIFWDITATLVGAVALFALFVAHEYGHVFMLRRRKIAVTGIALFGVHGETSYDEYAGKPGDATAVAWGGIIAQAIILVLALAAHVTIPFAEMPIARQVWGPMFVVFTNLNIFLMIIALLPIGPFDGHAAWKILPRRRKAAKRVVKPRVKPQPAEPDSSLTPEQQREYDAASEKETADLMARLTRKSDAPTQDR